ncbi:MAG: nucleoside hydrolase [Thermobacillus sp.]|uniref:nucleoside hydrolase n=1 Tax=Thermobacillus sp. TaxID=2108467 RepID=UPI000E3AB214|nr:nucleoside hydrolase [Thermobacillus sp.]REK52178.1 MAG: nucleoside hydrolase [Thermobacillus sp.]
MTTRYPGLTDSFRLERLHHPGGKVRMVLDTDTYNEIDDQFAVIFALGSPERLKIEALCAAPFHNERSDGPEDGMVKSYEELQRIVRIAGAAGRIPIYEGSRGWMAGPDRPVESEAARRIVELALASPDDDPLYVVAIGAITNVASAILMEPSIIGKIVVVWLGGHAPWWDHTREFNMIQDVHASRIVLDCGVPLVLVPCMGVASHLLTTKAEIDLHLGECGAIGRYLAETYAACSDDHYAYSRVIWDISTIGWLLDERSVPCRIVHSPILNEGGTYSFDQGRHLIKMAQHVRRDAVFRSLFDRVRKLAGQAKGQSE